MSGESVCAGGSGKVQELFLQVEAPNLSPETSPRSSRQDASNNLADLIDWKKASLKFVRIVKNTTMAIHGLFYAVFPSSFGFNLFAYQACVRDFRYADSAVLSAITMVVAFRQPETIRGMIEVTGHAQPINAPHAQLGINNRPEICSHAAGSKGDSLSARSILQNPQAHPEIPTFAPG